MAGGALLSSGVAALEDKLLEGTDGSEKPEGVYAIAAMVPPVATVSYG